MESQTLIKEIHIYHAYATHITTLIMADGANASGIISTSTSLNEVGKLFGQLFELLFAIIGFGAMNTNNENSLLTMALVLMVALYYLMLVMVTMFELHIKSFIPLMMVILLLLGTVVSFLALMMISRMVAWIYLGLLILIFASMCYKNRNEFYQMIPERIKKIIDGEIQSGNSEISAVELGHFQSRENLNV